MKGGLNHVSLILLFFSPLILYKTLIMKKSLILSLSFLAFSCFVTNSIYSQTKNVDESFSGIKKLDIDLSISEVVVTPSNSSEVTVVGYYKESEVSVKVWKEGSTLKIDEKLKLKRPNGLHSEWKITIPEDIDFSANLRGGDMTIKNCSGDFNGNCGTGGLDLYNFKGDVSWNCGTGDYNVEDSQGAFSFNTGTGDYYINNVIGSLSMNSGTGDVKVKNSQGAFNANSGTGNVKAENLIIEDASSFNSGTGDVEVKLNGSTDDDLSVNSGTGDAELDMNGHSFEGTLHMVCSESKGDISAPFDFDKTYTEGSGRNKTLHKEKKFGNKKIEIKVGTGTGTAEVMK